MKDYSELKRLAEAADNMDQPIWDLCGAGDDFEKAATPAVVSALISERDAYRAALEGAGYRMLDNMTERGPDFSRAIGSAAATLVMGIQQERDQLKAELEALRKDAERYRWLKRQVENCEWMAGKSTITDKFGSVSEERVSGSDDLDHTIDAAMQQETK